MSTKKINAGDTLTVGDLTDDHLGAEIEVGPLGGITYRFRLSKIEQGISKVMTLRTSEGGLSCAQRDKNVKIITPPPVVQPDKPTILGQCIRIEGDDNWRGMVVDPQEGIGLLWDTDGYWRLWDYVLRRAGERQIIVSDPPRWPDETPEVPEHSTVQGGPKAGDKFHRIEDMPYGWIAEVTLGDGSGWGYVVRHDDEYGENHLWDDIWRYGKMFTSDWAGAGTGTVSGGGYGEVRYTLVETEVYHNIRVNP